MGEEDLGDHNPKALLNTIMFMNGLYFTLIQLVGKSGESTPDLQRRHLQESPWRVEGPQAQAKGGCALCKLGKSHGQPILCVTLKMYQDLCPVDCPDNAFYLVPLKKYTTHCWFSHSAVRHNTLKNFVANMCKDTGIQRLQDQPLTLSNCSHCMHQV